jgi:hypothetical protein
LARDGGSISISISKSAVSCKKRKNVVESFLADDGQMTLHGLEGVSVRKRIKNRKTSVSTQLTSIFL